MTRAPLLAPVACFAVSLALTRTDLLPPAFAALALGALAAGALAAALLAQGALRRARFAWLMALLAGMGLGALDLWRDARAIVADARFAGEHEILARVWRVEPRAGYRRLWLEDVRLADVRSEAGGARLRGRVLFYFRGREQVRPGDALHARARLWHPENARNPGAFDWRAWCFDHRVALLASPRHRARVEIGQGRPPLVWRLRERVRAALDAEDGLREGRSIVAALLLAERGGIPPETMHAFAATGAAHLLAISGLHTGMAALFGFALVWWLLVRREAWIVRFPVRDLALAGGLATALVYAWIAGWPPPATRAVLMLAAGVLAWRWRVRAHPLQALLAALLLMLAFEPAAVASVSLWLSFAATWAILLWARRDGGREPAQGGSAWQGRARRWLAGGLAVSFVAFVATLPWIAAVFGRLPLYSLPVNLLMTPWFGGVVLPLALSGELAAVAGAHALAGWLLTLASHAVQWGADALRLTLALPAANLHGVALPLWAHAMFLAGAAACGWLWLRGGRRAALAGVAAALALYAGAMLHERRPAAPQWMVWDAGQGAASCLATPEGGVVALDAPGRAGSRFTGGDRAADAMRASGLLHADWLIVSHAQSDHMGGAMALLRGLNRIGGLALPDTPASHARKDARALVAAARERGIAVRFLARGDALRAPGVRIEVLWPPRGFAPANANDASLVLRARLESGGALLWPGDIERGAERRLLATGMLDAVDAMLAPHHGSRTSSSPAFVARLAPGLLVAQAGRRNRYGFPAPEVMARWRRAGAMTLNTADGAVIASWPEGARGRPHVRQWREAFSPRRTLALRAVSGWMSGRMHFSGGSL